MYKSEFDKEFGKKGIFFKSILLYGEEEYFLQTYLKKIAKNISEEKMTFFFEEFDFQKAKEYLLQPNLFGDKNLLIIKHSTELPRSEVKKLLEICSKNKNSFLIYQLFSKDAKNLPKIFSTKLNSCFVRFFKPFQKEAKTIIKNEAKTIGVEIDDYLTHKLLSSFENDISAILNEIKKISIITDNAGKIDFENFLYENKLDFEKSFYEIIDKKEISLIVKKIEEEEINEIKFIMSFQNFFYNLFLFHINIKLYGKADSKDILGYKLPPDIERKRLSYSIRFKTSSFFEIFSHLLKCEAILKSQNAIEKRPLLYSCLIKLQALL
jgi:DNA polymerase-3 subunit delta